MKLSVKSLFHNSWTDAALADTLPSTSKGSDAHETNVDRRYCEVHRCDVTDELSKTDENKISCNIEPHMTSINFPSASTVCETSSNSKLYEFNPLEEGEPNLDLCMTDQNTEIKLYESDINTKLIE